MPRLREDDTPASKPFGGQTFVTTRWSLVGKAGAGGGPPRDAALEELCRAYWPPLYAFVRRKGFEPADAEDFTQAFFARLLESNYLAQVAPGKGRFRSFLMAALQHFIGDELDKAHTQKRGGSHQHLHLDTTDAEAIYAKELVCDDTPERAFDRRWARAVLGRAEARLRDECAAAGKSDLFTALGPGADGGDSHEVIAARLGLTMSAVKSAAFRLRQRYRELIRDEIAQTVSSPAELEAELRDLMAALAN